MEDKIQTGLLSIFVFLVKYLINRLHNSRTNYSIDIKLKSLSKLYKRDTSTSRKFGDEIVVIFSILGKFGVVYKPDSRLMARDLNFSVNNYLMPTRS